MPLSTDRPDGFDCDERLDGFEALLWAYAGTDRLESTMPPTVSSVLETAIDRPELYDHAELYERDATYVRGLLDSIVAGDF